VRPTDEHQSQSTRPNFMSATRRPAGSSDNILARLERGGGARRHGWSRKAKAGTVAGAVLILALVWLVLSLAQDNLQVHSPRDVVVTAVAPSAVPAAAPAASSNTLEPAVAVKFDPPAADADDALVEPTLTPPPLLAEVVEAPVPVKAPAPPRVVAVSKPAPAKAPRTAPVRSAPPARPSAVPVVDSDVALLSAILINTPRHSAERARAEAACNNDKKCQPGGAASILKTTD
jgi:hypothetical protein